MTKAALREKRRQERLARRNRNRIIFGVIAVVIVAALAYLIFNEQVNKPTTAEGIASGFTLSDAAVTTASGLIYEDLVVGEGAAAQAGDTVNVTYTGYLTDGTVFDSNVDSGQPFEFQLGAGYVIPGWDEGIEGMKVGEARLLGIPPDLAIGAIDPFAAIPENTTLTYSITLKEIK